MSGTLSCLFHQNSFLLISSETTVSGDITIGMEHLWCVCRKMAGRIAWRTSGYFLKMSAIKNKWEHWHFVKKNTKNSFWKSKILKIFEKNNFFLVKNRKIIAFNAPDQWMGSTEYCSKAISLAFIFYPSVTTFSLIIFYIHGSLAFIFYPSVNLLPFGNHFFSDYFLYFDCRLSLWIWWFIWSLSNCSTLLISSLIKFSEVSTPSTLFS